MKHWIIRIFDYLSNGWNPHDYVDSAYVRKKREHLENCLRLPSQK